MVDFHAVFAGTEVVIEQTHHYRNNDILTAYMNYDFRGAYASTYNFKKDEIDVPDPSGEDLLIYARQRLLSLKQKLMLDTDMNYDTIRNYHQNITAAQKLLDRLDAAYVTLPPYCDIEKSYGKHRKELFHCVKTHDFLFESNMDSIRLFLIAEESTYAHDIKTMEKLGMFDQDQQDFLDPDADEDSYYFYLPNDTHGVKGLYSDTQEYVQDLLDFNQSIDEVLAKYLSWIDSVLRAHTVYADLLNNYIHIKHAFLTVDELARQYAEYLTTRQKDHAVPYEMIENNYSLAIGHEVVETEDGTKLLGESYDFTLIESLLYVDFFQGLKNNYFPKQCFSCKRWFLLPYGKYSDYCENPSPEDPSRTCRELGARKRYQDKVRNDPVWLTYNRAYKAHYARKMKKKMTAAEFEAWSSYALELRDKALRKEISLETYQNEITK